GEGNDLITGGDGIDTLRETADTDFTLSDGTLQSDVTGTDTFTNIERVALTGGDIGNIINASNYSRSAFLYGRGGNDTLIGGDGNDLIKGGEDNDLITGGAGNNRLYGEGGSDTFVISSITGRDTIYDFEEGVDFIGLSGGLIFGSLTIQASGNNTNILQGDNLLAVLVNVNINFSESDFTNLV
ncbi:hypothetical protein IQ247_21190, partial [Plectonema cf. radiosum LEGE 06105]|nr:hypothetical protein [Plectonema cf. radiosum LEGE 06105]